MNRNQRYREYIASQPMPIRHWDNGLISQYEPRLKRHEVYRNGNLVGEAYNGIANWICTIDGITYTGDSLQQIMEGKS